MIPPFIPNRRQRKRAERLAKKHQPVCLTGINLRTAIHEIGHLFCCLCYGFPVERVSLTPANVVKGVSGPGRITMVLNFSKPIECAAVAFAGEVAEQLTFNDSLSFFGPDDLAIFGRAMSYVRSPSHRECEVIAKEMAAEVIRPNLAAIRQLAEVLLAKGELTAADIRRLVEVVH